MQDIVRVELFAKILDKMRVLAGLCQIESRPALDCLAMQTYLLRKEVQKDVHVSAHRRHVQVGVVIGLFLVAVGSPVDELFDAFVGAVQDGERHDSVLVTVVALVEDVNTMQLVLVKQLNYLYVVFDDRVMKRHEFFLKVQ